MHVKQFLYKSILTGGATGNSVPKISLKRTGSKSKGIMKKAKFFSLCLAVAGLFFINAARGDDLRVSGESASNGLNVVVSAPGGFTNRVEIYTCSNLVSANWRLAAENLRPSDGTPVKWHTEVDDVGFFVAGNMDVDSDGDGMPDAREKYIHKTDPQMWDSDSDGVSDGEEMERGTDPNEKQSRNAVVYANSDNGNAGYNGYAATYEGGTRGPKKTILDAITASISGDTIELSGTAGFTDTQLSGNGRNITLRANGKVTLH